MVNNGPGKPMDPGVFARAIDRMELAIKDNHRQREEADASPMKPHGWRCKTCGVESTEENEVTFVVRSDRRFFECNDCAKK